MQMAAKYDKAFATISYARINTSTTSVLLWCFSETKRDLLDPWWLAIIRNQLRRPARVKNGAPELGKTSAVDMSSSNLPLVRANGEFALKVIGVPNRSEEGCGVELAVSGEQRGIELWEKQTEPFGQLESGQFHSVSEILKVADIDSYNVDVIEQLQRFSAELSVDPGDWWWRRIGLVPWAVDVEALVLMFSGNDCSFSPIFVAASSLGACGRSNTCPL